ncbi:putative adenylate kinase [Neospora caninum Liverpool]|uniref:Adenylate kinase, putative n=1 Tax=Neospora caninum (strain Liverpool) TaxID=572307 RepID=F0VFT3_NEOCL|nr:putative adenylate kinase [Neospora caninum Liverpool]CBZ52577.1 putative adenylate kinase [Neospora caninum Liverpool]CEL66554.1 TPA: adenylate kinase, putative [Neospora caninum Liverpool]|eukprot:XP_003882609.1 putative adenylate kinase [Neospora caninum Liverpool]
MAPANTGKKTTAGPPATSAASKDAHGGCSSSSVKKTLSGEKPTASSPPSVSAAHPSPAAENRKPGGSKKTSSAKNPVAPRSKTGGGSRRNSKASAQVSTGPHNDVNAVSSGNNSELMSAGGGPSAAGPSFVPLVCLFGPPCSGKGTLAALLKEKLGMLHCSTGDLLRQVAKEEGEKSEVGAAMKAGKLVNDRVIVRVLQDAMAKNAKAECKGIILDGFPRNGAQVDVLREMKLWPDVSFLINVPHETLLRRMAARRVDPVTGEVFGLGSEPTDEEQKKRLIRRDDDSDEVLENRIKDFAANMACIAERLTGDKRQRGENTEETGTLQDGNEKEGKTNETCELIEVPGDRDITEVFKDVHEHLQQKFPTVFS